MFKAWCDHERSDVLLSESRIVSIVMAADTVEVAFRCWCGEIGSYRDARYAAPIGGLATSA